ncbi:hypothetical protein [Aquimarina sp. 2201CG5-10]|uniref:hypothetical protein n=1 Tax=Aquimarina callyspongiae TaxID=3098150 RepID=UPI002AB473E8|nr:hypothetical protein [Aquimarina sp. 2201CG5-10]MDY8137268.1 hypothetical protein [Aquimarina sp. 2201CG5-10]
MTAQEKRPLVFLTIDLITFSTYFIILLNVYKGYSNTVKELPFWGTSILIFIPIMILSRIIFYLLYSIFNTVLTKKKEEKFLIDELGEIIKLKASRNFNTTFMLGFVVTMILLSIGASIPSMFKMFYFSILSSFIAQNISEYYYSKKGI